MGKRKQTVPQRTTEEKQQCLTWNMLDHTAAADQAGDMTIIPDNDPSLLAEQQRAIEQQKNDVKTNDQTKKTDVGYKNEDLKDIFDLHIETCLFHLTGYLNFTPTEEDWFFELAKFKITFAPGPLFLPLPLEGLPTTETCTLWISAAGEKSVLSFEKYLENTNTEVIANSSQGSSSKKKKGKSKHDAPKEIMFWLVDVDLPQECLLALKCKTLLVVMDQFDTSEMTLTFKIVGTEAVVSKLSFPSEAIRPRQHNLSLKTLVAHFYRISETSYEGLTYNKKHDINQLYGHIKERHENQTMRYLPDIQHEKLLPKLRPYQKGAITWMVNKEKLNMLDKGNLDFLYTEFRTLDGKILYFNRYTGIIVKDRPHCVTSHAGGILADEMGLGKTVEVLGCMLHNPREDITQPELQPIIEDDPLEEIDNKKQKKKKKKKGKKKKKTESDSDSEDSDSTVVYSEDLIERLIEIQPSTSTDVDIKEKNIFTEQPKSHSGEFECICGNEQFQSVRRRKKRKHTSPYNV